MLQKTAQVSETVLQLKWGRCSLVITLSSIQCLRHLLAETELRKVTFNRRLVAIYLKIRDLLKRALQVPVTSLSTLFSNGIDETDDGVRFLFESRNITRVFLYRPSSGLARR